MYDVCWAPMLRDSMELKKKKTREKSWKCTFFLRPSNHDLTRLLSSSSGINEMIAVENRIRSCNANAISRSMGSVWLCIHIHTSASSIKNHLSLAKMCLSFNISINE